MTLRGSSRTSEPGDRAARAYGEAKGYRAVSVRPWLMPEGACGTAYTAPEGSHDGEAVEADAEMDIGHTLIGMHLKRVAVPFRPPIERVGKAPVVMAFTRPPLVWRSRARVLTARPGFLGQFLSRVFINTALFLTHL